MPTRCRNTWPGWGHHAAGDIACYYGYRVSFPKVDTPPTITPFAPLRWLGDPIGECLTALAAQTPMTLLALPLAPLIAWAAYPPALMKPYGKASGNKLHQNTQYP